MSGVLLGTTAIAATYWVETPLQRLMTIWERDPGMLHLQPTIVPTAGGATFGLVAHF